MSRIDYPDEFGKLATLSGNILAKHTKDGTTSVLLPFLAQQNIDLSVDATSVSSAQAHDTSYLSLIKQSGNYHQQGEQSMKPVMKHIRGEAQFLKAFYKPNFKAIGDWGITIEDGGKIIYPTDVADQVTLFTNIVKKHNSFLTGTSPLQAYLAQHNIDLDEDAANAGAAQDSYNAFLTANSSAENETQQRDEIMEDVVDNIHQIGDFLKKLFDPNTKAMGAWGFTVDESAPDPKEQVSKVDIGGTKVTGSIVRDSIFTNLGTDALNVIKGRKLTGLLTVVPPGGQLAMTKGYSSITVTNPSKFSIGKYKVLVHK